MLINLKTAKGILFLCVILLGACRQGPDDSESAEHANPTGSSATAEVDDVPTLAEAGSTRNQLSSVLISEILTGVPGGNNHEFIELYNPGVEVVDLNGWSLWYLTRDGQEAAPVYAWNERADIPGLGHYLLVHDGEAFGLLPDAVYDTAVFEGKGGLSLRNADGDVVDRLGWGDAPQEFFAGSPVIDFEKGYSLERLPGGESGSGRNSGDNARDFVALLDPDPQNSGSQPTPLHPERLEIRLKSPDEVPPGADFQLAVSVENLSREPVSDVLVSLPVADYFTLVDSPAGSEIADGRVTWHFDGIDAGQTAAATLVLTAPFANVDTQMSGYFAESAGLPRAYGELNILQMDGSAIPIAVARSLPEGSMVTVEGVVTMYPGGFFAGSSSAKFYLEDETGGIQIFADGGRFDVSVNLGDRVRATGQTELFRDSLEVIPQDNVADIVLLDNGGPMPEPAEITIVANETDDTLLGRLNVIEGTVVRIDDYTYHYEIDLEDEGGNKTLLYVEKDTGVNAERLNLGSLYRVTGISELASGIRQLKPRLQSDFVEIFPPVLLLQVSGPSNILPGETMTLTLTAVNHTETLMTNVQIVAEMADGSSEIWMIPGLEGHGGSESVNYRMRVADDAAGIIEMGMFTAVSDQWTEPAAAQPHVTYVGEGVPIWAIQGNGNRSPLIGEQVTAVGVVTGAFPAMDGFFLQSMEPDGDLATSDGIFVDADNLGQRLHGGDIVEVHGRVREDSGQTILRPPSPADIVLRSEGEAGTIEPVLYDPPADPEEAEVYKESLEGMLVTIAEPATVIAPTNQYGEYALVYEKWDTDRVRRIDSPVGFGMWVDDGTFDSHEDQSTLPVAVARGDTVTNVVGPLAYTFDNFKIAPVMMPDVQVVERPIPTIPEAAGNQFSVATFNVENLFDSMIPHPDSQTRPSDEEYQLHLHKVAEAIIAMGAPAILAVQEVENIGVLEALVNQPQLTEIEYVPILLEGNDSRGIDVGYLVHGDRATVTDFAIHDAPNDLFSRPPLVLSVTVHLDSGDQQLVLINNHFLSLSAGEVQTEPVRNNQAAWNVTLLEQLRIDNPDAQFIVLGDLNSFYQTKPMETLQEGGLRHAYEFFSEDDLPYTYIFDGASQTLDHILMSEGLFSNLTSVEALHIDADYPIAHPDDTSPRRVSDHDPLVATFTFE